MELLKTLYEIYSPSGGEKKLKKFIKRWVRANVADAIIRTDNNDGNVYIVRGFSETYPCVVAHLDQVQHKHSEDFMAVESEDIIFGYSSSNNRREGLGADDKNGIWVALKCLEQFENIKVAFFVGEEIGCVGSSRCDMSWFDDCRFVVEPDRRGAGDLITNISGRICSEEFERTIDASLFGYSPERGMMTDVLELSERGIGLSCINLSCGYYKPHTDEEYTVKADLINCLNLVKHIIEVATDVYTHKYVSSYSYASTSSYGFNTDEYYKKLWSRYYNQYADDYEEEAQEEESGTNTTSEYRNPPYLVYINEYADLDSFVDQLIWMNHLDYTPDELWPYIESDLATYEIDQETFEELAWDCYEYYNDCDYGRDDIYDGCNCF